MTVLDKVRDLIIRCTPDAICDDCITDSLKLSVRQHANHKTRELANQVGFDRQKSECSVCGSNKKAIRYT